MPAHTHILVDTGKMDHRDGTSSTSYKFLCGKESVLPGFVKGEASNRVSCPECGKIYWAEQLKAKSLTVEKLPLELKSRDPDQRPWRVFDTDTRSLWKVMRNGEHIAWVYLVSGWGKGWQLSQHKLRRDVDNNSNIDRATVDDVVPGFHFNDRGFKFRDQAVCWLADQFTAFSSGKGGGIDPAKHGSREAYLAEAKGYRAKQEELRKRREEEDAQAKKDRAEFAEKQAAERAEAVAQLQDLAARQDLTNYQRAGLQWALAKLSIPARQEV